MHPITQFHSTYSLSGKSGLSGKVCIFYYLCPILSAKLFHGDVAEVQGWPKSPEYAFFEEDVYARRVFYCTDEGMASILIWAGDEI